MRVLLTSEPSFGGIRACVRHYTEYPPKYFLLEHMQQSLAAWQVAPEHNILHSVTRCRSACCRPVGQLQLLRSATCLGCHCSCLPMFRSSRVRSISRPVASRTSTASLQSRRRIPAASPGMRGRGCRDRAGRLPMINRHGFETRSFEIADYLQHHR